VNSAYFEYKITADYSPLLDAMIDLKSQQTGKSKFSLGNDRKQLLGSMTSGVAKKYDTNNITGEIKVKGETVIADITLSYYAYSQDFAANYGSVELNKNKDKVKILFPSSYVQNFLPSAPAFILTKN
jgi:hypothetical protein